MRPSSPRFLPSLLLLAAAPTWADSPAFLNSNDVDSVLPAPNLPAEEYRPRIPDAQLSAPRQQRLPMSLPIDLRNVQIEGGSVYPFEEIAGLFEPLIGRKVALRELLAVTEDITRRYQTDGYALSYAYVPAQNLDSGQVRVVLVEGYISAHEVRGKAGRSQAYIDRLAAKLIGERPLRKASFERYTTLMAQIPGMTVRASVAPPSTTDGAVTLVTEAALRPFAASASLADDSQDDLQAVIGVSSNSLTRVGEQLSVSVLAPPGEDNERYARLDYSQFVDDEGTRVQAFASTYRSDPKDLVAIGGTSTEQSRRNDRLSLGVSHPFLASPRETLNGTARLYAVEDKRDYARLSPLPVVQKAVELESRVRVLALEGDWRQADAGRLRMLSAGFYQGIDGLGAESEVRVLGDKVRSYHDLDFQRLRLSGLQSDQLGGNWQGVLSGAFYWSGDTLPESEQVLFGDRNFGRGYPDDQTRGDKGWGLGYELNRSFAYDGNWLRLVQPYAALDAARAWYNRDGASSELSSFALGVRIGDRRHYNLALEAARPLGDRAIDSGDRAPRVGFTLSYWL
ncbi:hypothetical protein CXK94_19175 [Stutzerimonas stutzeri]|uniref:ShlB/FhaC/HecB family hemolysin secretion/activation protein n=1 Tax=Stutzerimonas stutzeri TaxID=316 RepID=A0A2N8STN4_STUST|nr:POTRA domain-containing protein [Stutzerimonas stutzeri]MCQ4325824.1 ShlB/FhaC/HecB family hemolysin secretion/activation protein [Stutzerimonas stutzeri]PNG05823.1 hypothetical protein CXK94_19175 [Stutzerimonas stutzeri]